MAPHSQGGLVRAIALGFRRLDSPVRPETHRRAHRAECAAPRTPGRLLLRVKSDRGPVHALAPILAPWERPTTRSLRDAKVKYGQLDGYPHLVQLPPVER